MITFQLIICLLKAIGNFPKYFTSDEIPSKVPHKCFFFAITFFIAHSNAVQFLNQCTKRFHVSYPQLLYAMFHSSSHDSGPSPTHWRYRVTPRVASKIMQRKKKK